MSELDKKIQKSQPDLVQSVLEAQDKKNVERVDMLITNALKQLKMSRFKPDQATCLSLIYLARISPKSFSQSANLKEILKSYIKRDNGPANLKATIKNDFILPVLAANILIASADSPEVRTIILKRIEQWLSSCQKISDNVQHLLALLCIRCQGDQQTIQTLIDMRQHWFNCLHALTGSTVSIALDLCDGIRKLLNDENSCVSLIENLTFLIKHDGDVVGLAEDVSRFILCRPISFNSMLEHRDHGSTLRDALLQVYNKLFEELKMSSSRKREIEYPVYFRLTSTSQIFVVEEKIIEALLTLLASIDINPSLNNKSNVTETLNFCSIDITDRQDSLFFTESDLTIPYNLPTRLRRKLIQSNCESLIDIGLHFASPSQLAQLLQQFGTPQNATLKLLDKLNKLDCEDLNKLEIKDSGYFGQFLEFLAESGIEGAANLKAKISGVETKDVKSIQKIKRIKVEA